MSLFAFLWKKIVLWIRLVRDFMMRKQILVVRTAAQYQQWLTWHGYSVDVIVLLPGYTFEHVLCSNTWKKCSVTVERCTIGNKEWICQLNCLVFLPSQSPKGPDRPSDLSRAGAPSEGRPGRGVLQRSSQVYEERWGVHKETQWKATRRMMTQHWCTQMFAFFYFLSHKNPPPCPIPVHTPTSFSRASALF